MARSLPLFGAALLLVFGAAPETALAEGRSTLGTTRVFTNDTIADRQDRWRSGAYSVSLFRGQSWSGALPDQFGAIMEYRFRGEVIAPDNLANPAAGDRLYAGTWWLGAHSHLNMGGLNVTVGADLAITGEQTGIRNMQSGIHDALSMPRMDVEDFQVENGVYLHGTLEVARSMRFASGEIRPFVELQAGVETMARAGFDLTLGDLGNGGLRTRDPITGQRLAAIDGEFSDGGWSFLLGADTAYVASSIFLPEDRGYEVEDARHRVRAGVNYGFGGNNVFYGIAYMSEEFVGQAEGQLVGSLSVDIRF